MISTFQDDWLKDRFEQETRWIVELSDGSTVFQDDGRPGTTEPAWVRLRKHCQQEQVYIRAMRLQFRSHIEHMESDCESYFFSKSISGGFGSPNSHSYLTGTVKSGILRVMKWQVPELIRSAFIDDTMEQVRDIDKCKDLII